jgi:transcriptional regulator with XRE-family HTH domain
MENNNEHFTVLENKKIGHNLALYRKLREKKALEVAEYLGMKEASYTRYERGEAKITVDIIQKVAEFLNVDPLSILSAQPGAFIESFNNSPFSDSPSSVSSGIGNNSSIGDNFNSANEKQAEIMMKLMENMLKLSGGMLEMMGKK